MIHPVYEKLCMKQQLNDEKTCVDPWSHIDTFEGWTVLTETIVISQTRHSNVSTICNYRLDKCKVIQCNWGLFSL